MSREEIRFLADVAARPLSTTVSRYQRLNLSRRRGNAIRQHLADAGIIEAVAIATRSGQVVLYQLTDLGRSVCESAGIDPGPSPARAWSTATGSKAAGHFEERGFQVVQEHRIEGDVAPSTSWRSVRRRVAVEVEDWQVRHRQERDQAPRHGFDRVVLPRHLPPPSRLRHEAAKRSQGPGQWTVRRRLLQPGRRAPATLKQTSGRSRPFRSSG